MCEVFAVPLPPPRKSKLPTQKDIPPDPEGKDPPTLNLEIPPVRSGTHRSTPPTLQQGEFASIDPTAVSDDSKRSVLAALMMLA
jgi:hypothetical protein